MHIHHGMKERNPVANLRFFPKHTEEKFSKGRRVVARELDEKVYRTQLPMVFEDKKVRVFCRQKEKVPLARKAFALWCKRVHTHAPFPSSQDEEDEFS